MFWVVQSNISNEQGYHDLVTALGRMGIPHVLVKAAPFTEKMLPAGFDLHGFSGPESDLPEAVIDESGPVVVFGTLSLAAVAKNRGWVPGSFLNENFAYPVWSNHLKGDLLNDGAIRGKLGEIQPMWERFFVRPCEDNKAFNGVVLELQGFDNWRKQILKPGSDSSATVDTEVMAAPQKTIYAEYRFFVVDGIAVSGSRYKLGSRPSFSADVPDAIEKFAQEIAEKWQPARAFVIDVADTPEGSKIVEFNNINSAGFYCCNMGKIVAAIEEMTF